MIEGVIDRLNGRESYVEAGLYLARHHPLKDHAAGSPLPFPIFLQHAALILS